MFNVKIQLTNPDDKNGEPFICFTEVTEDEYKYLKSCMKVLVNIDKIKNGDTVSEMEEG
jgi:hypothetical protein